jgi:hypothetical protein
LAAGHSFERPFPLGDDISQRQEDQLGGRLVARASRCRSGKSSTPPTRSNRCTEYAEGEEIGLDSIRDDVAEINHYRELTTDAKRTEATAKRHNAGKRTARENIEDLCDPGSFHECGPLVTATRYRDDAPEQLEERIIKTAADAMVMGVGRVNGDLVGADNARCVAMSYDYTVLACTQGGKNHQKQDRMFAVAEKYRLPVVLFTSRCPPPTDGSPESQDGPGSAWPEPAPQGRILHVSSCAAFGRA